MKSDRLGETEVVRDEMSQEHRATIGVGDGSGRLFVSGPYDAVKRVQGFILENEELRSKQPFNGLTPAEAELLALTSEECSEVGQVVGKILRHGLESFHPDFPLTSNRELLEKELGDVTAVIEMLVEAGVVNTLRVSMHAQQKRRNVVNYLHHN